MKLRIAQLSALAVAAALYIAYLFAPTMRVSFGPGVPATGMPGWGFLIFGLEIASSYWDHVSKTVGAALLVSYLGNLMVPLSLLAHKSRYILAAVLWGAPVFFLSALVVFCASLNEHGFGYSWGGMVWALAMAVLGVRTGVLRWGHGRRPDVSAAT